MFEQILGPQRKPIWEVFMGALSPQDAALGRPAAVGRGSHSSRRPDMGGRAVGQSSQPALRNLETGRASH